MGKIPKKQVVRVGVAASAVGLVLFVIYQALWASTPLSMAGLWTQWELWNGGVKRTEIQGFPVLERNFCGEREQRQGGCTCVGLIHDFSGGGPENPPTTWKKILLAPRSVWHQLLRLDALDLTGRTLSDLVSSLRLQQALASRCERWVLVGSGSGAWLAAWLGIQEKSVIARLVLAGPRGLEPGDRLLENLPKLHIPTLVLWGSADRIQDKEGIKSFAVLPHEGFLREISGCGHVLQEECEGAVIQAINDMIDYGSF